MQKRIIEIEEEENNYVDKNIPSSKNSKYRSQTKDNMS
jgi:hypothetical protein